MGAMCCRSSQRAATRESSLCGCFRVVSEWVLLAMENGWQILVLYKMLRLFGGLSFGWFAYEPSTSGGVDSLLRIHRVSLGRVFVPVTLFIVYRRAHRVPHHGQGQDQLRRRHRLRADIIEAVSLRAGLRP
jgi:hypothetical protein